MRKEIHKGKKAAVCIVLLVLAAAAAITFWAVKKHRADSETTNMDAQQEAVFARVKPAGGAVDSGESDYLADCIAVNPQTVAWLTIPDTAIDFPIMQCEDNSFYLTHDFEGAYYGRGCPFLDYRCSSDFTDFNSIIYGHNIQNRYMFAPLLNFREQKFLEAHATGELTLSDEKLEIHWIACDVVQSDSFIYSVVHPGKSDRETYLKSVQEYAAACIAFVPEDLTESRLVILSTCSDDYENARTVLIGYIDG